MNCLKPSSFVASNFRLKRWSVHVISKPLGWVGISVLLLSFAGTIRPVRGAERIDFVYGAFKRSLPVSSLEKFVKTGKIDADFAPYANRLSKQQLAGLRQTLQNRVDLSEVAVSQFLYSPIGETLLERVGKLVQTSSGLSGYYALRGATILSAADPQQGLTIMNLIEKFPSTSVRLDLARILDQLTALNTLTQQTKRAVAFIAEQSKAAATESTGVNIANLPNLQRPGPLAWSKQTLTLSDLQRRRTFPVDLYLPQTNTKAPLIVISYGLGEDRSSFAYLATHLATYGFAVAIPENLGSSSQQIQALLLGLTNEVAQPNEFVNRILDVKFLLDQLQQRPGLPIDEQQVGVIGQSFGGYTALALAGATINLSRLRKGCANINDSLNLSLVLQCRALALKQIPYNLRDPRIKAAIAINPVGSSIFGQPGISQIQIPVMIISGSADTVAPALPEQIEPFTWLTSKVKYLVMLQGSTHFSTIDETGASNYPLAIPAQLVGPDPKIAQNYVKVLSLAFYKTYLTGAEDYLPYLSSAYIQTMSQAAMPLSIIQSLTSSQLTQAINNPKIDKLTPANK